MAKKKRDAELRPPKTTVKKKLCDICGGPPTKRDKGKLTIMYDRDTGDAIHKCSNCLLGDMGPIEPPKEARGALGWDGF